MENLRHKRLITQNELWLTVMVVEGEESQLKKSGSEGEVICGGKSGNYSVSTKNIQHISLTNLTMNV